MSKETICTIPWNHIATYQNGEYGICCQCIYTSGGRMITNNLPENILNTDIDTIRNHPTIVDLRRSMLAGEKHELCKLCWDEEALGLKSKRIGHRDLYPNTLNKILESEDKSGVIDTKNFPLEYMDLRLGNLCNLKCRSCGPGDSSLWVEDLYHQGQKEFKMFGMPNAFEIENVNGVIKINSEQFQYYNSEQFKIFIEKALPTVTRIYFTGGEPLLNKKHYEILDYCIENDLAKNILLEYNTNGTTLNKNLLNQWSHFHNVQICFSVDAMGELAHYIRYPSKWKIIEKNMRQVDECELNNITCHTNFTASILNIKHLPEMTEWFYEQNWKKFNNILTWHRLVGPNWLNIQVLPNHVKQEIISLYEDYFNKSKIPNIRQHIQPLIDYMNENDASSRLMSTKFNIAAIDRVRHQKLADYIPWLADTLNNIDSIDATG